MRKAYIATATIEIVFVADEEKDNLDDVARRSVSDAISDYSEMDISHEVATYVPAGWTDDCLVYGVRGEDVKLKDALEATPEFVAARDKFKALKIQLEKSKTP